MFRQGAETFRHGGKKMGKMKPQKRVQERSENAR